MPEFQPNRNSKRVTRPMAAAKSAARSAAAPESRMLSFGKGHLIFNARAAPRSSKVNPPLGGIGVLAGQILCRCGKPSHQPAKIVQPRRMEMREAIRGML